MNSPVDKPIAAMRFGSGHTVARLEDRPLITGEGRYTDDLHRPDLLHLVFVRSPHAHARIVSIDTASVRDMPGVRAVFTGAELAAAGVKPLPAPPAAFKRADGSPAATAPRRALAHEVVRFVGEAVAAVVANTRAAAVEAAEAMWVDYESLSAVADVQAATAAGAVALCDQAADNIAAEKRYGDAAAVEAAFSQAAHVVSLQLRNQRLAPCSLEPRVVLAEPGEHGRLVVHLSSQMPTAVRDNLAQLLPGLSKEQVRVVVGDVGGGFGMKTGINPEDVVVAHAARTLQAPVRWRGSRLEEFSASVHGRDHLTHAELALDDEGRVLAMRQHTRSNIGGYATPTGCAIPMILGPYVATSVYHVPLIDLHIQAVLCNTTPVGAYRGAGRPEAIYAIERLMDAAAVRLKMDPAELRRRNLIKPQQMPYTNSTQQVYDSGQFEKMLDQALRLGDWDSYGVRVAQSKARGRLRGRSITTFLEWTGGNALSETVQVRILGSGQIELTSATMPMGQGIATSYAQLAVDVFALDIDRIRIIQGDTDRATGFGSAGSRSLFTGGGAIHVASQRAVACAVELAAQAWGLGADQVLYVAGELQRLDGSQRIGLFELAAAQSGGCIEASGTATASAPSWPNAAHVCEVEVDPDTGEVAVAAYASVNDIGRVVSPQIVQGQLEGGAIQGVGQALCEQVVYDENAQLLTASFMDYALPRADGFRAFKTVFDTTVPCLTNVLGAKGVGELGTIGATPAVVNAVVDALVAAGVPPEVAWSVQMPLTPPVVWEALHHRA